MLDMNCVCSSLSKKDQCMECSFVDNCIARAILYAPMKNPPVYVTQESIGFTITCTNLDEHFDVGDELEFDLFLFGNTIAYLNPILQAFYTFGVSRGLGREHLTFEVSRVTNRFGKEILFSNQVNLQNYEISNLSHEIDYRLQKNNYEGKLKFYTPATIKYQGKIQEEFTPQAVMNAITRRVYLFNCMEGNHVPELRFIMGEGVIFSQEAIPTFVPRYSNRKNQKMTLQGIRGSLKLEDETFEYPWQYLEVNEDGERNWSDTQIPMDIRPFLIAGEILGIGKNTKFGFGKYKLY
ncbi:conserved hypothetical cytosolic protein [Lachnospiraceae bacterium TWA4]|nr:conserved hypothetical cytosolic protein [Lachnospiraceae bacterium TWA4]